jgi:predicted unusual protein kinase regulating ubiquinone biosynthesis (AarF/ABC1/UbiB family)
LTEDPFPGDARPWRSRAGSSIRDPQLTDSLDIDRSHSPYTRNGRTFEAALRSKEIKVNRLWVLLRLFRIALYFSYFYLGSLRYRFGGLTKDERHEREAPRFRELLEELGGVFIKVGQQLSQRPDILPPAYCVQLQDFLKDIEEQIPLSEVEATIKRQTGKTIAEAFSSFNPDPIGSASVSCVYRANLPAGEEVAVKVRRPGIEKKFAADLKALKWVLHLMEFLTIWRPGMTRNLRVELERLLFEELDFLIEARYQEIFRRYLKRNKKLKVTAPKVYHEYSSSELMVSEFVRAYKMTEIIEAVETNDEEKLEELRRDRIKPKKLAKQLVRSRYYSFHECPLFHGDPHPANILVRPGNQIVMVDFGACGVFSEKDRNQMWHLNRYYASENVAGMVNMVIGIMEPVDPVNGIYQFRKDLTDEWWKGFYGIKSKHAAGWERSSVFLWLKYFELVRKHQIPIGRNVVRMVRATLLYDTVAARLNPKINVFKEFEKYRDDFARRTRRRIEECAIRQLICGPDDSNFVKLQQIADVSNDLLYRVQRFLQDPQFSFAAIAGKIYSAIRSFVRLFLLCGGLLMAGAVLVGTYLGVSNPTWSWWRASTETLSTALQTPGGWFVTAVALLCFLSAAMMVFAYGRRVYLRFGDLDD